ncbi:hypothetical protein FRC09_004244 [Ceratobasidium sp. 395]|nr:hypothetical protein FRC09_004244 [Ceratobasidium sp. 395]
MVMALIPGSRSDSRWGPTLNNYLDLPEANLEFRQLPDEHTTRLAIDKLLNSPEAVTFDTLETIMSMIYRPRMLSLLIHKNSIGGCMKLLQDYIDRDGSNGSLLEHAFGFLGLHVLALVLQVGLLGNSYLKTLPLVLMEGMRCKWDVRAPAIHTGFVTRLLCLISGDTLRLKESDPLVFDYQIEWLNDSRGDERACLPVIGGFTYRSAVFVLELLFKDRKMFLECCFRTRAPGWSILVYMIQWMLDDRSYEGHRVPQLWQEHRDIVYRYCLVSGLIEDGFMEVLCGRYAEKYTSTFSEKSTAVDFEDAQLIQLAFTRKQRPNNNGTHKRDFVIYGSNLMFYVRDSLAKYSPLQLAMNETVTEVVWDVLVCVGYDNRWQDVDVYMGNSLIKFHQMLRQNDANLTSKVIAIMHKYDMVGTFGRYVLLPSYLQNCLPDVLNAAPTTDPDIRLSGLGAIIRIGEALGLAFRHAETPLLLNDYYPDWYKTLLFLRREMGMHALGSYLHDITTHSESADMVLPSDSPFDPKWGPTLNEYLDRPEANLDFPDLPDEGMICLAMDNFLHHPAVVTFNTLETIMSALYRPAMLELLVNEDPVDRCMELLEDYAHRNGPESTASLHVLALILQVGLLDGHGDFLDRLPRALTENTQCPWDLKAPAIQTNFIPNLYVYLASDTLRLDRSGPLGGSYRIEWLESDSDDRDERACLPSIGGFMYRDAVFVLRQLFNNRKALLECCYRTRAPGWSILVCMIQFMLDDRSYEGRRVPQLWQMHRDIVYRYSLVSGLLEDGFMEPLCGRYAEQYGSTFFGKSAVIDFEDAQLIQLAFTRKYRPNENETHKRDLTYGTNVTFYVRDNLASYLPLQLAINETATEIVWDALLCVGHDKRWQDVGFYMGGSYGEFFQMLSKNQTDLTYKVIAMLHRFDVVGMFGRYILLPSYLQNCLPDVLNAAPTTDPNVRQDGLMVVSQIGKALGWVLRHAETPLFLDDYYPDWYKVLLFIWREKGVHTWDSYLYKVTAESEDAWMAFGDGLGFTKHLNSRSPVTRRVQECMYARCPDPEGARFESRSGERYCSVRCQVA